MKNIFLKLKINQITYFLFVIYLITGHIKNILLIFLIVLIHEIGHVFLNCFFHYQILSVEILPFGGLTKVEKMLNTPIKHDIIIYLGGVLFQLLLFVFFNYLSSASIISEKTYDMFLKYNFSILIFNLLPIRPLDGGEILRLILERFLSFKNAQKFSNRLSIIFLLVFLAINIKFNLNNYVIISFLLVKICELIKKENFYQNKFLLERHLHAIPYRYIKNEKKENLNLLRKDTYHFFKKGDKYISEGTLLQRKFDISSYFW